MAWAHFAINDYEQALNWARRVLDHEVSIHASAFAHLLLASSYAHMNRSDAARQALERALQLWPRLDIDRDLWPLFMGGDSSMGDRYVGGLHKAGLER
jgi:tetratricopeptide (TPR) repeat protein